MWRELLGSLHWQISEILTTHHCFLACQRLADNAPTTDIYERPFTELPRFKHWRNLGPRIAVSARNAGASRSSSHSRRVRLTALSRRPTCRNPSSPSFSPQRWDSWACLPHRRRSQFPAHRHNPPSSSPSFGAAATARACVALVSSSPNAAKLVRRIVGVIAPSVSVAQTIANASAGPACTKPSAAKLAKETAAGTAPNAADAMATTAKASRFPALWLCLSPGALT